MKQQNEKELSCLEVVHDTLQNTEGIVKVELDPVGDVLDVAYDTRRTSDTAVAQSAAHLSPYLQKRWETCTLRLGQQGGRACESCALALEKHIHALPGVQKASASYVGGVLSVQYDKNLTSSEHITHWVAQKGVATAPSAAEPTSTPEKAGQKWEAIFTAVTLVAMLAGLASEWSHAPSWVTAVCYTIAYIAGGTFGLQASWQALRQYTIDIDLLMVLAALGAAAVGNPFEGAMLLFLFSLSNVLQDFAMEKTRSAINALMKLRPTQALIRRGQQTLTLPIERVVVGDLMVVKPGDRLPLDGVVAEGESSLDQAPITGESMPVSKKPGDTVFAGSINQNGSLDVRVSKLAKDSTIARLIQLVEEAHSEKAHTQRFIDTAEQYYAVGVIAVTLLAIIVPIVGWQELFSVAFYRAMTIMVAASPCALVISTPATVLSAIGNGARRGILFKGGAHVENAATIKAIAFDKTGTLTIGKPQVTDVMVIPSPIWQGSENELLALAAAAEAKSEHILAKATVEAAQARQLTVAESVSFQAVTGKGIEAQVGKITVRVGNLRYFEELKAQGLESAKPHVSRWQNQGKTSVLVAQMDAENTLHICGVLAFADVVRPTAVDIVRQLKANGIERVIMLTGDNRETAATIAQQTGVDEVYADLLPEDKVSAIKTIAAKYGPVAMVGDGVNDAPALATATLGIAMGAAGTDVALETADIVLMSDKLENIPYLIALSHQTRRTLVFNLGFALFMILLMLATIFITNLPLPLAVIGHEGGTVLVSLNGLRLLGYNYRSA